MGVGEGGVDDEIQVVPGEQIPVILVDVAPVFFGGAGASLSDELGDGGDFEAFPSRFRAEERAVDIPSASSLSDDADFQFFHAVLLCSFWLWRIRRLKLPRRMSHNIIL